MESKKKDNEVSRRDAPFAYLLLQMERTEEDGEDIRGNATKGKISKVNKHP